MTFQSTSLWFTRVFGVLLLLLVAIVPNAAAQATPGKSNTKLSARLEQLALPQNVTRSRSTIAQELSLPTQGPGSLQRLPSGEVLTTIRVANTSPATLQTLASTGARVSYVSNAYHSLTAYVKPSSLPAVAALDSVEYVAEALRPVVRGERARTAKSLTRANTTVAACPTGIVSEGDIQLRAKAARDQYGISGAGVKVGIISDSFGQVDSPTSASDDIASGDLPGTTNPCGYTTPVIIVAEGEGADEGRAMAQIIHDLAPDAELLFATAGSSQTEMADNIRALRQAGADVIVDDIFFFGEPMFQDGPIGVAIQEVTSSGAIYFAAAGNANTLDAAGQNISSYEAATYRPVACPALFNQNGTPLPSGALPRDCHTFAPTGAPDATSSFTLAPGGELYFEFQWAEPWYGVVTDLDIYLVDANNRVLAASRNTNTVTGSSYASQKPLEYMYFSNNSATSRGVSLVIGRDEGAAMPRIKYVLQRAGGVTTSEYNSTTNLVDVFGPTVGDHVASLHVIGTAATPYNDGSQTEQFSSLGPATHYFGAVLPNQQAAMTLARPEIINKPDVAATNGVKTTFFYRPDNGFYRFFGTSAAAPHGAGVAALLRQRANQRGLALNQQMAETLLETTATTMTGTTASHGAGLIDTLAAAQALSIDLKPQRYLPFMTH